MIKNVLQLLEKQSEKNPDKIIFGEANREICYKDFVENAKKVGSGIAKTLKKNNLPIAIFIDKTINCLEAMCGVNYSGNFYTIIDTKSPVERAKNILNTLEAKTIITDSKNQKKLDELLKQIKADNDLNASNNGAKTNMENAGTRAKSNKSDFNVLVYEDLESKAPDQDLLDKIRDKQIDTDPMYVLFTSGSTGIPKGVVITHSSVLIYTNWFKNCFNIDENTIFGNQVPFYFSMSISDVFTTMVTGASLYIIPKMYFSFPVKLLEFLNEKKVNTIYWVPSALCIVANLGALKDAKLSHMNKILFAGETMPVKQLNMWRKAFPDCMYANLFGPTETTDICTYYVVDRDFKNDESLPIGKHCDNCDILLVNEKGEEAKPGEKGEILARGPFLAKGYYGNEKKTKEAFIQNPLNTKYPEIVYKTGDIAKYNENGELIYLSRKDYQIKHMGYRIELGEIEKNIYSIDEIVLCACIYDEKNQMIVLCYQGDIDEDELAEKLEGKLLPYMMPNKYIRLSHMPYNSNGKIDRKKLNADYENEAK